ncbi:hypothetical protein BD410DRAFT_845490 [Rickenella mellea]|uniref:Uncharacterized protein n=1 Tax=Rickenella mellea TaxID=50990 RepID=A0A4Y7PKX1_9AGAM|nr:hypothetical protein BD410DRAFT_845490 [Rickenella mellea]
MSAKTHSEEEHATVHRDKEAVEQHLVNRCAPEYKQLLAIIIFLELARKELQDATTEKTKTTASFRTTEKKSFGDAFKLQQAEKKRTDAAVKLFAKIGAVAKQYEAFVALVAKECKEAGDDRNVQDVFVQLGSETVAHNGDAVEAVKAPASH